MVLHCIDWNYIPSSWSPPQTPPHQMFTSSRNDQRHNFIPFAQSNWYTTPSNLAASIVWHNLYWIIFPFFLFTQNTFRLLKFFFESSKNPFFDKNNNFIGKTHWKHQQSKRKVSFYFIFPINETEVVVLSCVITTITTANNSIIFLITVE